MIKQQPKDSEQPEDRKVSVELATLEQLFGEIERRSFAYVLGAHRYLDGGHEESLMSIGGDGGTELVMVGILLENFLDHNPEHMEMFGTTTVLDFIGQAILMAEDGEEDDDQQDVEFNPDKPQEGPDGYGQ